MIYRPETFNVIYKLITRLSCFAPYALTSSLENIKAPRPKQGMRRGALTKAQKIPSRLLGLALNFGMNGIRVT